MELTPNNAHLMRASVLTAHVGCSTEGWFYNEIFNKLVLNTLDEIEQIQNQDITKSIESLEVSMALQLLCIKLSLYKEGKYHLLINQDRQSELDSHNQLTAKDKAFINDLLNSASNSFIAIDKKLH